MEEMKLTIFKFAQIPCCQYVSAGITDSKISHTYRASFVQEKFSKCARQSLFWFLYAKM